VIPADLWTRLEQARADDPHEHKAETEGIRQARRSEVEAEMPHPQCCDLAKEFISAYRDIDILKEVVLNDGVPVWKSVFNKGWDGMDRRALQIHFCPFCGVKLPAFQRKANPPPYIVIEDGRSNHCGRCGERYGHGYCWCSYPESAFEPVPV
jgi:hypothetical protein